MSESTNTLSIGGEISTPSMSRHSRAMLLNVLWHHQGGSSQVGQPIRSIVGLGQHDRMTDEQVAEAKWIDGLLAAPPPAVPEGWALVPVEPTDEMALAGSKASYSALLGCCTANHLRIYKAMLAAAPAPAVEGLEVVAHMWQHEDTGRIGFVDQWQIENGFEAGNPRLRIIGQLVRQSDAAEIIASKDAEIERLTKERDEALLIHQTDTGTASAVEALQATIAHQAERIAELEASLEIEKGQCELREEENRILFARMEAQAAALAKAKEALDEVQGLIEESAGVYGLHLNGDPSPWDELEAGGRFERLTTLPDALASLAQLDGAQAGEEGKEPRHD